MNSLSVRVKIRSRLTFRPVWTSLWLLWTSLSLITQSLTAQTLDETREQFLRGEYEAVVKVTSQQVSEGGLAEEWRSLLVRSLLTLGRYEEAFTNAQVVSEYSGNIRMILLARETALYRNNLERAESRLEQIKNVISRRPPAYPSAMELVSLGQGLLLLGVEPRLVLENCYRRAQQMSPPLREAYLATGQLALDKYDYSLAANTFRAGLQKFPDDPDLLAGLAAAFQTGDPKQMLQQIDAALEINPRNIRALLLLADHLIDAEQYAEAEKQLIAVLKINPSNPEALAYCAVLAHLRNEFPRERSLRDQALEHWKKNPQVDHLIGRKLSQKYRFVEGASAQRRALDLDTNYLPALRQLAEDLLRLGNNDEGWQLAEAVHKQDEYDVLAYNLSTLSDRMAKFRTLTNDHFLVRLAPLEADLYGDRILALLERARETLCRKYGVALDQRTVVEIFPNQRDFAVRTFGMPGNPGYLGVCFGNVITANSPASQAASPVNWEDVLWHEFCHVVTLNATKNRMPRWFSEGISTYEERQAHPAWGERMNLAYRDRILDGQLTPLGKLSSAFLTATNSEQVMFAYYESSLVIEFLIQKNGLAVVRQILADLGDGVEMNASIADRTATPLAQIEKEFHAFAVDLAEKLAPGVDLRKPPAARTRRGTAAPTDEIDERAAWTKLNPDNYYVQLEKAHELIEAKRWVDAKPVLESLARAYHGESGADNPLWLLAITHRHLQDTNAELATLEKLARQEAAFVDLYARLIELHGQRENWAAVTNYADGLLAVNPLIALPHRALAKAGTALGNNNQAITAYRKLLLLDPADPADAHYQLARLLHQRGDSAGEARRHVLHALEEAPRFRDAHRLLLDLAKSPGNPPTNDSQVQ